MLRITRVAHDPSLVILKVEGRIVSDWVPVLEEEIRTCLSVVQALELDLSGVSFIDHRGVKMLKKILNENLRIVNCSPLIHALLSRTAPRDD